MENYSIKYIYRMMLVFFIAFFVAGCQHEKFNKHISVEEALRLANSDHSDVEYISGVIVLEFEDYNLYSNKRESVEKINLSEKCISLDISEEMYNRWKGRSGTRVVVKGRIEPNFCDESTFCPSSCNLVGVRIDEIQR